MLITVSQESKLMEQLPSLMLLVTMTKEKQSIKKDTLAFSPERVHVTPHSRSSAKSHGHT